MDLSNYASFGDILRALRRQKRITQQQLANTLKVHRNTISFWECGDRLPESRGMVLELARQLNVDESETRLLLEASLTALAPYWAVPYRRNPFFTGREELLRHLHTVLAAGQNGTLTRSCAITGLGGIGKTQTALEYTYRHAFDYSGIFWMSAETYETLLSSFLSIADVMQLSMQQERDQLRIAAAVVRWLNNHSQWLLIVDNVEDPGMVKAFLPASRDGSILFTTRLRAPGDIAHTEEMPPMSPEEGALFLLRRARFCDPTASIDQQPTEDAVTARTIAQIMDGLPLALDQAGAYIEEAQCNLSTFLYLFHSYPLDLLNERALYADHASSVVTTFALAEA
nr:helix-turn-helix domain-containing protein [Chloroflexota bacterium]